MEETDNQLELELRAATELFRQGDPPQAEMHLRRFLARGADDRRASSLLEDLRRAYGISGDFELSERAPAGKGRAGMFFLVKVRGGDFWSKAHGLVAQLLLAELTRRTPVMLWGSEAASDDADRDGFGRFFKDTPCARMEDIPESATIYPPDRSLDDIREQKTDAPREPLAAQYLFDRPESVVMGDGSPDLEAIVPWIGRSSDYYGLSADALYAELFQKYLRPAAEVSVKLDDFFFRHMQGRPWVGVQVSGCPETTVTDDFLQRVGGYTGFIGRIVALNPSIGVLLLTESPLVRSVLRQVYGERLLCPTFSGDAAVGAPSPEGGAPLDPVSEIFGPLLALRCDYFVGSQASYASLAIASLRDWPAGFFFLLGEKNVRGESPFALPAPRKRVGARKKVMFYSDWHYGDVHMSRPYVMDLMEALGDCDFYYQHCNNPKLLADIKNLTYTRAKIAADVVIDTWIGQSHYRGMAVADFSTKEGVFGGCNFPHYHEVMREVYQRLGLPEFLKPVEYYLPTIDYTRFDIANIDRYFAGATGKHVLVCNNAIMSGQAPEVRFNELVPALAAAFPGITFLISNDNGDLPLLPNVRHCTELIDNPATVCDLNEISYISTHCALIVGRSSGPYSFSVTRENMEEREFLCVCNERRDTWYLETSTNISWTDNPSTEHLTLMTANLIMETT